MVCAAQQNRDRVRAGGDVVEGDLQIGGVNDLRIAGGHRHERANERRCIFVQEVMQVVVIELGCVGCRHELRSVVLDADGDRSSRHALPVGG